MEEYTYQYETKSQKDLFVAVCAFARLLGAEGRGEGEDLHRMNEDIVSTLSSFEEKMEASTNMVDTIVCARQAICKIAGIAGGNLKNIKIKMIHDTKNNVSCDVIWTQFFERRSAKMWFNNMHYGLSLTWDKPLWESKFARWCGFRNIGSLMPLERFND